MQPNRSKAWNLLVDATRPVAHRRWRGNSVQRLFRRQTRPRVLLLPYLGFFLWSSPKTGLRSIISRIVRFSINKRVKKPQDRHSVIPALLILALALPITKPFGSETRVSNAATPIRTVNVVEQEAENRLQQGIDQLQLGEYEAAAETLQEALALYREIGDQSGEGRTLKNLGNLHKAEGNFQRAIECQLGVVEIALAIGDKDLQCRALINLGSAYKAANQLDEAVLRYRESLDLARQIGDQVLEATGAVGLGSALYGAGRPNEAIPHLEVAKTLGQEANELPIAMVAAVYLARSHESLGQYSRAVEAYRTALSVARDLGKPSESLAIQLALASAYYQEQDYPNAVGRAETALRDAEELQLPYEAVDALGQLARAHIGLGDTDKALHFGLRQLEMSRELGDLAQQGLALEAIGIAYLTLGNYLDALGASHAMLAIARELPDSEMEGRALRNLGQVYLSLGEYDEAARRFEQQLTAAREAKDWKQVFDAWLNLGDLQIQQSDFEKAVDYYQRSLRIAQRLKDNKRTIRAELRLGNAHHYLEQDTTSLDYARQGLEHARASGLRWEQWKALQLMGRAYVQMDDARAIDRLQDLVALSSELNVRTEHLALNELAGAYLMLGNGEQAVATLRRSQRSAREAGDAESEATALEMMGSAFVSLGDLAAAEAALRDSLKIAESIRAGLGSHDLFKVSIFERRADAYDQLQSVLIARNQPEQALEVAERGRARAFAELLNQRLDFDPPAQIPYPNVEQIRMLARNRNSTLVEYSVIEEDASLLAWVIQPGGQITMRRIDFGSLLPEYQDSLEKLVSEGRQRLGVRGIETFAAEKLAGLPETSARRAGPVRNESPKSDPDPGSNDDRPLRRLHRLLIEPISDLLSDDSSDEIVFMPQGALFLVPFPALQGRDGKYLVEKHAILMAPSIQVLELTGRRNRELRTTERWETQGQTAARQDLVVGNPSMPRLPGWSQPLPPLPAAELEAKEIAQLLGVEAVTGAGATKTEVVSRMSGARYVHLATHGILDDKRGFASAIALAPSAADNGLLSADEIADLQLQAELVVLSACNTGRGRITGDGVIGLSRSFISAGAPSVLVSLWSVPDTPTALLMTEFYKNLGKQHGKAQALRLAMLTTMREYPEPLNWAAFTLIGESDPTDR